MPVSSIPRWSVYDGQGNPVGIVLWVGDEWSALYVNGKLVSYGDHYHQDEWLFQALGGIWEHGDEFLGGTSNEVYEDLDEVRAYHLVKMQAKERAATLREQAAALVAEAEGLEKHPPAGVPSA